MGDVGIGIKRVIQDVDGDTVGVTGNALDVHLKTGTSTIDIAGLKEAFDGYCCTWISQTDY